MYFSRRVIKERKNNSAFFTVNYGSPQKYGDYATELRSCNEPWCWPFCRNGDDTWETEVPELMSCEGCRRT